ncbi:hypothetical protein EJB05_26551, partial [Eragrostis curvula]
MSASSLIADAVEVEGSHVLKIKGYSRTKMLSDGKSINVKSKDAGWISFFLYCKGSEEVEAKYKFSLLDEMGEPVPSYSKSWSDIISFKAKGWGNGRFIEKKALEDSSYLKDDSFRVRCDLVVCNKFRTEDAKQFVTVPPPDMQQHIGHLLTSQVGADVTIQVGMETFTAHRLVLAARSPVLMAELFVQMKKNNMCHIQMDDMEPRVLKAMLHYIYNDSLLEVEKEEALVMAQQLLAVADRYDLTRLKLICEDKLCNFIDTSTVVTALVLAKEHGCNGLKKACFEFLKLPGNLKAIMLSDGFQHLTSSWPSILKELGMVPVGAKEDGSPVGGARELSTIDNMKAIATETHAKY